MEELQRKVASRRGHRAHLTKLHNKMEDLMAGEIDAVQRATIGTHIGQLEQKSQKLSQLDTEIADLIEKPKDLEQEILESEELQCSIAEQICRAKTFLEISQTQQLVEPTEQNIQPPSAIQATQPPQSAELEGNSPSQGAALGTGMVSTSSNSSAVQNVSRLPRLILPTFDGNPLYWQSFWDSYRAAVHDNPSLSDIQKFNYLRAQLRGDASRSIAGFPLTNANYQRSIELLQERFGQSHRIINAHMEAMLNLPNPTTQLVSLQHFYDTLETHIRGLEALGKSHESYGGILVPIIHKKLPVELKKSLARDHSNKEWTLDELRKAILKEVEILEAGRSNSDLPELPSSGPVIPTASFLMGLNRNIPPKPNGKRPPTQQGCAYCKGKHNSLECTVVRDPIRRHALIQEARLCFNCLGRHRVTECKSRNRCRMCHRKHHTSLCPGDSQPASPLPVASNAVTTQVTEGVPTVPAVATFHTVQKNDTHHRSTLLKTAISPVEHHGRTVCAHILFDEGSQRSFVTGDLARQLLLTPEKEETISLSAFGGTSSSVKRVAVSTITLLTDDGEPIPIEVIVVPTIAAPIQNHMVNDLQTLPHLQGLKLAHPITDEDMFQIDLLIGADHYWNIVEDHIVRGPGPTAAKSKIGYLLSGPVSTTNQSTMVRASILHVMTTRKQDELDLKRFWNLESIGIKPPEPTDETTAFLRHYQDTSITLQGKGYNAKLPWKEDHPPLPTNTDITQRRTRSMVHHLAKDPQKLKMYNDVIVEQERRGFIERVACPEITRGKCHYLPHHAVFKESATTPLRVVYDCSCRQSKTHPSLNDCLLTGPPIANDLTGILLRFRCHKYGFTTDIEKAFLHVSLNEEDRDATRFFWLSDPDDPTSAFHVYCFKVVLFGASSSPFILNATLNKHLNQYNDPVAEDMKKNIYVDDLISGVQHDEEATTYYHRARTLMSPVGFNLRSWASNSPVIQSLAAKENLLDDYPEAKVLGVLWNTTTDMIKYPPRSTASTTPNLITKREVLQESSKIYDPIGFLGPVTVRAKILMQELWRQGIAWDEPLPPDLQMKWKELATELETIMSIAIPRQYFPLSSTWPNDVELHVFVDASTKAYGTVAYLNSSQENYSSFVMAKSRVAPTKELTLPQLELTAAVIGARLASHLQSQLHLNKVYLWSDSQIVLYWLCSTKELKPFVANRVKKIKGLTSLTNWKYCPTSDNPADLLTRGISSQQLKSSEMWKQGPSWLPQELQWPAWSPTEGVPRQAVSLLTAETTTPTGTAVTNHAEGPGLHQLITVSNFSTLSKLLSVTAYVLRFVQNLRKPSKNTRALTTPELHNARNVWIKNCQQVIYHKEISNMLSKSSPRTALVRQLRLFLDDTGLICCGGRIHNAPVSESAKFPRLLPPKDPFTELVIRDTHIRQLHAGVNSTLTALRLWYWIPAGRQHVKKAISHCVTCKKISGLPYDIPDPPPLPKSRLQQAEPFTVTGVDFTGALHIREAGVQRKVYICLFTCATTRAIHLEVVTDLSVQTFLLAYRRFAARKSVPQQMISDNASTYLSAAEELTELFQSQSLKESLSKQGVNWQFIPKRAPWYGGFWERLIGLTKTTLKKVLGRASVNLTTLQTIIVEIEAILNDRPLTHVSSDVTDEEPLTPAHLLYGRRITALPHIRVEQDDIVDPDYNQNGNAEIQRKSKRLALLLQHFWTRWRQEYLTSLREFHKTTGNKKPTVKVGDVVLVHDEGPRINWKLAVVEELLPGRDGHVRAVNIRTQGGTTNRPIAKLYPLEISAQPQENLTPTVPRVDCPVDPCPKRTQRAAAARALQRIAEWTRD